MVDFVLVTTIRFWQLHTLDLVSHNLQAILNREKNKLNKIGATWLSSSPAVILDQGPPKTRNRAPKQGALRDLLKNMALIISKIFNVFG